MIRLGIVTGMQSETACLKNSPSLDMLPDLTFCAGGSPGRAYAGSRQLIERGATALISFGIAGALDPTLTTGDVILADKVTDTTGKSFTTDAEWRHRLETSYASLEGLACGSVVSMECAAATPQEKASIRDRTGAVAVDMESSGVAAAASESGIPFSTVRVIADTATRALPQAALSGLAPDGATRPWVVLGALARRPWEVFALMQLGRDTAAALHRLRRVAARGF